jgi:WD40 repeat protein
LPPFHLCCQCLQLFEVSQPANGSEGDVLQSVCSELWRLRGYDHFSETQTSRLGRLELHRALRLLEVALAGVATRLNAADARPAPPIIIDVDSDTAAERTSTAASRRAPGSPRGPRKATSAGAAPKSPARTRKNKPAAAALSRTTSGGADDSEEEDDPNNDPASAQHVRLALALAGRFAREALDVILYAKERAQATLKAEQEARERERRKAAREASRSGRSAPSASSRGRPPRAPAPPPPAVDKPPTMPELPTINMGHALAAKVAALVALQAEVDTAAGTAGAAGLVTAQEASSGRRRDSAWEVASQLQRAVDEAAREGQLPRTSASGLALACSLISSVAEDYSVDVPGTATGTSETGTAPMLAAQDDTSMQVMMDADRWSRPPLRLARPPPETSATALTAYASVVVVGGDDGTVTLWESGRAFRFAGVFTAHRDAVLSMCWLRDTAAQGPATADGHGQDEGQLALGAARLRQATARPRGDVGRAGQRADALAGMLLCTGSADRSIALWRICAGQLVPGTPAAQAPVAVRGAQAAPGVHLVHLIRGHEGWVRALTSGTAEWMVEDEGADDEEVCDVASGKEHHDAASPLHEGPGPGNGVNEEANDSPFIYNDDLAALTHRRDMATQTMADDLVESEMGASGRSTPRPPSPAGPRATALRLVSGAGDRTVQLHDPVSGETLSVVRAHEHWVASVVWQPGSNRVLAASADCSISVMAVAERATRLRVLYMLREAHGNWLRAMTLAPNAGAAGADGHLLFTGGSDGRLRMWRLSAEGPPEPLQTWRAYDSDAARSATVGSAATGHQPRVVALAARGNCLASASDSGEVVLWKMVSAGNDEAGSSAVPQVLRRVRNRWSEQGRQPVQALLFHRGRLLLAQDDAHVW